jgi:glutamate--cysteine ligase
MAAKHTLSQNLMGIEKESLRVSDDGSISQESHPKAYGSALTNSQITTDFCEALVELVTPPFDSADKVLEDLGNTEHFVHHYLPDDQRYWPASMPCVVRGETYISIAQYGSSNRGQMKTVYRQGLANRYGSVMQTIAGIHFNYSFSSDFWQAYQELIAPEDTERCFIDSNYMGLTRNVLRCGWLIPYLFGASASICKSFLEDYHQNKLEEFDENTLYLPYATSLRMGDIGYQNSQEDAVGVKANYNSLCHYTHSLQAAMQTSCAEYESIGLKQDGEYQQLNTNILQIENEYYASIRPKPKLNGIDQPLEALNKNGINYIELRSLDTNPLLPLGIDKSQILFLEAFLLYCLLEDSPAISTAEQFEIDNNDHLVAHQGRKPGLKLKKRSNEISLQDWGREILDKITSVAVLLGDGHEEAVQAISERLSHPDLTPSATMLQMMRDDGDGFYQSINKISLQSRKNYRQQAMNKASFAKLDKVAKDSLKEQAAIEKSDTQSFDEFIDEYFSLDG